MQALLTSLGCLLGKAFSSGSLASPQASSPGCPPLLSLVCLCEAYLQASQSIQPQTDLQRSAASQKGAGALKHSHYEL